jgi:hypothetical protein
MRKSDWVVALAIVAATPALSQTPLQNPFPDLRGT